MTKEEFFTQKALGLVGVFLVPAQSPYGVNLCIMDYLRHQVLFSRDFTKEYQNICNFSYKTQELYIRKFLLKEFEKETKNEN